MQVSINRNSVRAVHLEILQVTRSGNYVRRDRETAREDQRQIRWETRYVFDPTFRSEGILYRRKPYTIIEIVYSTEEFARALFPRTERVIDRAPPP